MSTEYGGQVSYPESISIPTAGDAVRSGPVCACLSALADRTTFLKDLVLTSQNASHNRHVRRVEQAYLADKSGVDGNVYLTDPAGLVTWEHDAPDIPDELVISCPHGYWVIDIAYLLDTTGGSLHKQIAAIKRTLSFRDSPTLSCPTVLDNVTLYRRSVSLADTSGIERLWDADDWVRLPVSLKIPYNDWRSYGTWFVSLSLNFSNTGSDRQQARVRVDDTNDFYTVAAQETYCLGDGVIHPWHMDGWISQSTLITDAPITFFAELRWSHLTLITSVSMTVEFIR